MEAMDKEETKEDSEKETGDAIDGTETKVIDEGIVAEVTGDEGNVEEINSDEDDEEETKSNEDTAEEMDSDEGTEVEIKTGEDDGKERNSDEDIKSYMKTGKIPKIFQRRDSKELPKRFSCDKCNYSYDTERGLKQHKERKRKTGLSICQTAS